MALHKCDNRACVRGDHIYEGTHQQNMADRRERKRVARGDDAGPAKLDSVTIEAIRIAIAEGESQSELARLLGVTQPAISHIVTGRNWKVA